MRRSISSIHGTRSGSAPGRMIDRILLTLMISMAKNPTDHQGMQYNIRYTERKFGTGVRDGQRDKKIGFAG